MYVSVLLHGFFSLVTHKLTYSRTHTHAHTHSCACTRPCTHASTHTHTHSSTHSYARVDILSHFEICELSPSGEYTPAAVHHADDQNCGGTVLLQQGIQRRIRMTLIYEAGSEIHWTRVNELCVGTLTAISVARHQKSHQIHFLLGRIRSTLEVSTEMEHQSTVLSLSVFRAPHYPTVPGDDRQGRKTPWWCVCVIKFLGLPPQNLLCRGKPWNPFAFLARV